MSLLALLIVSIISVALSSLLLIWVTLSHYLDELITSTVSIFIRGRGSVLNVYRRKQFAAIVDRYQLSARVP